MAEVAPLGIFGGTFDPVHVGHLRLAEEAADALGLAGVRWIPAGRPRHRDAPCVDAAQRLRMVELAIADNPRFGIDAAEVATGASYTVPTLERLRAELGGERPLVLLLGADAFAGLATWHRWRELPSLAHLGIAHRPGCSLDVAALPTEVAELYARHRCDDPRALARQPAGCLCTFAMTPLAVSATQLRALLAEGRSVRYLLPPAVIDYIDAHHLYRNKTAPNDGS